MKRRILSIITALALCLSLCPTWAFAVEDEPDTGLCNHHREHIGCGYTAPTEGHDCGHRHTAECYTKGVLPDADGGDYYEIGADTENLLDCQHSHDSECGYVEADPGAPCGYVCRICPIEDLIAALPEQVTEDNAADVRGQLDHILDLYRELNEDEQEEINLTRIYALQGALDAANAPMTADGSTEQQETDEASVTINGETLYYATLGDAFDAANGKTATITMLNDAECVHSGSNGSPLNINGGNVTLNLNGNTLFGKGYGDYGIINVSGGSLLVQGEEGKVKVTRIGLSCRESGKLTVEGITLGLVGDAVANANAGIDNEGGTVILNRTKMTGAASVGQIYHHSGTTTINNVTATGTTDSCPESVMYYSEGTLTINGGAFDKIAVDSGNYGGVQSVAELLGEGCAYKKQDGTWATDDEMAGLEISNVTVKKIPLTINPNGDTSWYYSTQQTHTLAMNAAPVDSSNSVSYEWKSGTETLGCTSDAYTVPAGTPVGSYTYTCEATCDDYTLSHTFTFKIEKSGTDLADGKIKTYNGSEETTSFSAGDTITVKAAPTPTGAAPATAAMLTASLDAPSEGQMAVFVDDTQVSEPVGAGEDGSYTMTVSAADVLLAAGGPKTGITLTARFTANDNMADGAGTVTVNITAAAKAELDGKVIGYYGESNLADAFDDSGNDGATFTLLANVEPNTCLTIQINCILNLGGHTITGYIGSSQCVCVDKNTAVTIRGEGEIISPNGIALAVDGSVTLEGGTYTSTGSEDISHGVYVGPSAMLSVTGEKVSIRNTSGGYGLIVAQAQSVQLSAGTYSGTTEAISSTMKLSDMLAHTDNIRYAYYQGDALVTTGLDGQALTGTVTVKACTHAYQYAHTTGTTTHNQTCPACGDAKASEKCDFSNGPCPCGAVLAVTLPADLNLTYNGTAQEPGVTVTMDGTPLDASNYEVTYADNINAGTNAAKVTVTGKNYTGTTTLNFTIGKATLTVDGTGTASGVYGTKLSGLTVGGLTAKLGETEVPGAWKLTGDAIPNVGDTGTHEATFTPDNGADNYEPLTAQVTLNITPAPALTPTSGTLEVQNKQTKTYTYDLTRLLPALSDGKTLGDVTYTLGDVNITAGYYDSGTASISGTTLTLPIQAVDTEALADIGTVTVTITSQNYADMTATITVKSVNKTAVDITGVTLTGRAYNGSPIEYQQTAAASVDGSPVSVKGFVYTWNTPDGTAPVNAGNYTLTVSVDPEDPTYTGSTTIPVTIEQAEITITAPSRTIYVGGTAPTFSASDCTVTGLVSGESLKTPPTVAYEETPDTSKTGSVTVKASGAAVPDGGNYKDQIVYVDGTLTVKEPSSSGGGGGTVTPPVTPVAGVSLNRNSLTLTIGERFSLTVTITPADATDQSVSWTSSNSEVASVSGGTVTAVGEGTATITVTTRSGGHTAVCTVTVKAKPYTITYDANGGAGTMGAGTATDGEAFTLPGCTFTPPEGKVFDCWAVGSAGGTQVKAGSSHTFTEDTTVYAVWKDAPLVTYAVTYNANGGAGTMTNGIAPDQEAFVLPECGFAAPEGKVFDTWAVGSVTGPKVHPGGSYTFTADTTVYALWKDAPSDITGIVLQNGKVVPGAAVQLKQGANVAAVQTTGADGSFAFRDVPPGVYNLVAEKDGITVTVMQEITSGNVNLTITLPNGRTNTVVEIKDQDGTPPVVVGSMENLFTDDTVYTAEDKEIVAAGGTVEFKMVVERQDASSPAAVQIEARKPAGQTIGLFLDLSIVKTVTPKDGQAETTSVTQVGSLIETLIPLPDEMQGKASYTVYREHDGIVEALPNSGNGERYTVSSDKKSITIYARKYSTYAVAWSDNGGDTPVDPGKPSRPSGGSGSSVSTYAVTVSKTTYGKVVSSRTNASSGSTVTLTVTPDSGYTLDTLTVTDSRGNAVKLTDKGNGKYTFTMPSRAVTVTASFAPIVWNNPYTDVATGTWYYEAVRFVSENGLMGGYGKGLFGPNDNLSRAQLVQILYNHAGRPVIQNGSAFTDAAPGAWYADAVAWAAAEGIISGYGGGRFGPNDPITREQLAVILWRYAGFPVPPNLLLNFPDANTASGYALDALRWAVDQGIISGYSNGRLEPKTPATRGQVAQILQNFFQKR